MTTPKNRFIIGEPNAMHVFCSQVDLAAVLGQTIGTLRSEDGDGRQNVAEKVNSRSFGLHRGYSKSLTLSNVGESSKS